MILVANCVRVVTEVLDTICWYLLPTFFVVAVRPR